MNYTPVDLESITFKKEMFYGYNREQVNRMIDNVYEDYLLFEKEIEELQKKLDVMKDTIQHYKTIEEALQHTLIIAQHTGETIVGNASEKAEKIIKDAENTAHKIIDEANDQAAEILSDYDETRKSLNLFKKKSQSLLLSALDMLKLDDDKTES